ncbi:MAG: S41 family peptidase [Candidatus Omnitrophica bacterium]|nr:S41 family peptidase [Candidatus Omnitrophota bacterium]
MIRRNLAVTLLAVCLLSLLALSPARSAAPRASQEKLYEQVELLAEAITVIQSDYVEEVDPKKLIYGSLRGLVESLDRHSQFLDPDAYSEMQVETKGEFGGVGLEITVAKDGALTVVAPMDDTPAAKAGLRPQDRIVKIDGESTRGISLHEAVTKLRGRAGTKVILSILREEENRSFDVELSRAVIQIRSIKVAATPSEKVGYIRISEFQDNTAKDLDRALTQVPQKGLEGLILDLRNNPGGLLDVAVEVSGRFLPEGKPVLSTKGRLASQNQTFTAAFKSPHLNFPMVVLVNGGSASASEIVAGALRDHGRAILMGTKTFGKGSVQTVVPLRDGSAVRLTTSIYYTPAGHAIHGKGLEPDVVVEEKRGGPAEEEEGEQEGGVVRDPMVLRAVDLLKGLSIYGAKPQG